MADYDTTKWAPVDAPAAPPTESTFDTKKWAKVGASLGGKPAQMGVDRGPGFGENLKDTAERTLGYAGGAAVGSVGGPLGAALGGGVGATTADIDIARKHQAEYGTQPQLDPWSVAKDYGMNTLGAYAGEKVIGAAGSALKGALGFMRGEPGLVAGAEKGAQEVVIPKEEFFAQKADIERHTSGELKKLHESVAKEQTPEAQLRMFQQATGRTPEASMRSATLPAEAGSALPGIGQVERQQRFYRDITAPLQRASDAWAKKRDALLEQINPETGQSYIDQRVDAAPIVGAIQEENAYAQANAKSFSPAIQKLFASLQELGAPDPLAGKYTPEELAEMPPNVRANLTAAVQKMNAGPKGKLEIGRASATPMAQAAPQPTGPTVRELLGRRSEASRLASAATTATDRHAASSVADAVDQTLTQINAPKLDQLNAQYRQFKTLYPRSFGRALSTAAHPSEFANQVFGNPERALNLINAANAEEKGTLRNLYADAVNENGIDFIKPQHEKVLAQLYPRTPLATPQGFANVTSKVLGLKELLNSSPQAQQRFMQEVVPRARELTIQAMQKTTARAIVDARKMGPLGLQIVQRIESSTDPAEQFKIAIEAMTGVTPDKAAIASIQAGRAAKTSGASYYLDRAKNLTPIYASIGGPALAEGKVNYSVVMLAIGGAQKVGDLLRKPFLRYLADPETGGAANFWRAAQDPAAPNSLKTFGRATADAIMSDVLGETGKKVTGTTLEQEPDNKPSDMTKEYDRATAKQAAGKSTDPSRVEHLEKVNSDLRKSKTPDVHAGLRTGRLSMPAIKNLLKQQNQKTAPSLLAHLGPEDVKHLLALATPEERAWLEPLAQQRLGNG